MAKIYGRILKDIGLLSKGDVLIKNPSDFIGAVLGQSEEKTNAILDLARGCVLVIDEAYGLSVKAGSPDLYKEAVISTIVARVQGVPGDDMCVLLLGYPDQMRTMMREANPGLARRFQLDNAFVFEDYDDDDLVLILQEKARKKGLQVPFEALEEAVGVLAKERLKPNFGNGGAVENLLSLAISNFEARMQTAGASATARAADRTLTAADFAPAKGAKTISRANAEELFSDLIGCKPVLEKLREMQATLHYAELRGADPRTKVEWCFTFTGSPGTGKTTVARRIGKLYCAMGLLPKDDIVECSVDDLVAGYLNQSARKTREVFESALGGVLFIDEACACHARIDRLNPD